MGHAEDEEECHKASEAAPLETHDDEDLIGRDQVQ